MVEKQIPPGVSTLCGTLRAAGYEAYPVGGCVRDLLLGRVPGDWDVTTSALPEAVGALFPRTIPTGVKHGTVTVLMGEEHIEVTTFRAESGYADGRHPENVTFGVGLTEDLSRRDFTINAMALGAGGEIIDPYGGQADLKAGILRCVGDPGRRFGEDALRMFRAVRFSAQLGFALEADTAAAIRTNAHRAAALSGERIKAELEKILLSPNPRQGAEIVGAGLLNHLFTDWQRDCPWEEISAVAATRNARWRAFCGVTGFPISALPVERALRRGVLHPETEVMGQLALTGGDLCALGLRGPEVSAAQRRLGAYVLAHPGENTREGLLAALAGQ